MLAFSKCAKWGLIVVAMAAVFGGLSAGCYAEEGPPPAYADGYEPDYYDGRVVYYDDAGRPFYYVGGAVVWVSPESPFYAGYVHHWRLYGPAYHRWYGHYGYRYRGYHGRGRHR
jgi:hypothetical protein